MPPGLRPRSDDPFLVGSQMGSVSLIIDDVSLSAEAGTSILEAALAAGIYIPHICSHPDLPPFDAIGPSRTVYRGAEGTDSNPGPDGEQSYEGCGLCVVEVIGEGATVRACHEPVSEGMRIRTVSEELAGLRGDSLAAVLGTHPHACLTCCLPHHPLGSGFP